MLEKKYSNILFLSSFYILILSLYLYKLKFKKISKIYFLLFLTSINHWRNPKYDIKRNIDISMVWISTIISGMYSYRKKMHYLYIPVLVYIIIIFQLSKYFYNKNKIFLSTILHSKIHFICFIGNSYLYTLIKLKHSKMLQN